MAKETENKTEETQCDTCMSSLNPKKEGTEWVYTTESTPMCKRCALELWNVKCVDCGCLFYNEEETSECPSCEQEVKVVKATRKDILKIFKGK